MAVGSMAAQWPEHLCTWLKQEVLGSISGGCPGFNFFFSSSWLTNVDGMGDLYDMYLACDGTTGTTAVS